MTTQDADIQTIVRSLTEAFLGMEAELVGPTPDALKGAEVLTGCVIIGGAWKGAVILAGSRGFAERAATAMLGIEPGSLTENDLFDVIGELANVIGGNVKSLLASNMGEACQLSIPLVADGNLNLPGAAPRHHLQFTVDGHALRVRVLRSHEQGERWGG